MSSSQANLTAENLRISTEFLQQSSEARSLTLKQLGLGRYADFLTQLPYTEANITCVMRFLGEPSRVKFPDLRAADLSDLTLNGVNLIRGDLSGANLRGSCLVNADLIFAKFTAADLRDADLTGTTLNETVWLNTLVDRCQFDKGVGLTAEQRRELKARGGLFKL